MSRNNKSDFSPLDPKQAAFLTERFQEAAAKQPSLHRLRRKLLRLGGLELVAPKNDPDLDEILANGIVFDASHARSIRTSDSHCHEHVSRLWVKAPHRFQIVTGYALSPDGLWRSHTWAAEGERLVETCEERVLYFGVCLTTEHAARFAKANAYHDWRNARVRWPTFFAHHDSRRAHPARWEKSPTAHPPARKGEGHLSGRAGPVLNLLDEARQDWAMGASPRSLRGKLLEIFRRLDSDDGT